MVTNLPGAISSTTTSFTSREELARLGIAARERAEGELRHGHVGHGLDALPGHVPEADREPPVLEHEHVVDVAAHVHARRRLYTWPISMPSVAGRSTGQERALHRLGEVLLLLVEAGVVEHQRRLRGHDARGLDRALVERASRIEPQERQRPEQLHVRRQRELEDGRALREKRLEERRVAALEDRADRALERRLGDVERPKLLAVAAPVGMRTAAADSSKTCTIERTTASSVASNDRSRVNASEISNRMRSRRAVARSEASSRARSASDLLTSSWSFAFCTATASCADSAIGSVSSPGACGRASGS